MIRSIACLSALAMAVTATSAAAWGPIGHRITGQIAQDNINGKTRAEIERILGHEELPEAATWPDEERSSRDPFWRTAGPFHYVTLPVGQTAEQLAHPSEGDAATALERFTAVLKDPGASQADKALALRFVVHIVGDLHNPLHNGKEGDRGGNDVRVTWFDEPQNLHWVWDEGLINKQALSFTEYTARLEARMTPDQVVEWWDARPNTWIDESVALRDKIYPTAGPTQPGTGTQEAPFVLSWQYNYDWTPALEERLQQSGIRIAAYLDAVFAEVP